MPQPKEKFKIVKLPVHGTDPSDLTQSVMDEIQRRLDGANLHEVLPDSAEEDVIIAQFETFVPT